MNTKEYAYKLVDELDEEQLNGLIMLLKGLSKDKKDKALKPEEVQGILSEYANPDLIPMEEGAWERAAVKKYENA